MIKRLSLLLFVFSSLITCAGSVLAVVEVTISGINQELEKNVRLFLSIEQQKDHTLVGEGRLRRLHRKADDEINRALQPFGYYRPAIVSRLEKSGADAWQANYAIDPGPPLPIAAFDFTISEEMGRDEAFQQLLKSMPLQIGQVFNHLEYDEFKESLVRLASERGYFDAKFSNHRVEINLDLYQAGIDLSYEGGARYRYGEVEMKQDVLDDNLLRRYVPFEQGDHYRLTDLIELQHALNDSDYFNRVEVSPGTVDVASNEVPISLKLTPNKPNRYSLGLGYGTDTGARTQFSWQKPRVNRRGHRFDVATSFSELGYSLITNYRVPVLNPRTDQIIYSAGEVNEKTDTFDSTLKTLGASLKRSRGDWRESISLNYQHEDFTVADDKATSILLIPAIQYTRTWGRQFIYAVDGLRFDIGLRGASEDLFSDADFLQLQGSLKAITSINRSNRVIARGRLGTTSTGVFSKLPSSVRFFAGGGQSVRGFAYESLGPADSDGLVEGGKHLMEGSLEFEHSFSERWGFALFFDVGNAINDFSEELERGAGFGFRWKSPVGPVRIDIAQALTLDTKPWRLHLNIGPDL